MLSRILDKTNTLTRDTLILVSGTAIGQLVPILATPILIRIYTPEDFGLFGYYIAAIVIISILMTGRYELALSLPKFGKRKLDLYLFSIKLATTNFFLLSAILLIFLNFNGKLEKIEETYLFVPIGALLYSLFQINNYYYLSKSSFKQVAISKVIQSLITVTAQIAIGFFILYGVGIVIGQMLGLIACLLYFIYVFDNAEVRGIKYSKLSKQICIAKRYIRFPKYLILSHGLNALALNGVFIVVNMVLGMQTAGYFVVAFKMLTAPVSMVATAFGDVFRQRASEEFNAKGNCLEVYKQTFKKLVLISTPVFIIISLVLSELFILVFGNDWARAGKIAEILLPMFYFMFICAPLSNVFMVAEKQNIDLWFQSFFVTFSILPFLICIRFTISEDFVFILYSALMSLGYLVNIGISYKLSMGRIN